MTDTHEREFMGSTRSKSWTYLIFMVLLVVGVVAANVAVMYPELAQSGLGAVGGLPAWAFPLVGLLIGSGVFYLGLKIEPDWPEALGAFLISGSIAAGEIMIGWNTFAFGGLFILPYAIPLLVFLILMGVSLIYSR
jgi:hypothetical protein